MPDNGRSGRAERARSVSGDHPLLGDRRRDPLRRLPRHRLAPPARAEEGRPVAARPHAPPGPVAGAVLPERGRRDRGLRSRKRRDQLRRDTARSDGVLRRRHGAGVLPRRRHAAPRRLGPRDRDHGPSCRNAGLVVRGRRDGARRGTSRRPASGGRGSRHERSSLIRRSRAVRAMDARTTDR